MSFSDDEVLLLEFLDDFVFIHPNLNDTFDYACADTEMITLDGEANQRALVQVWVRYRQHGIRAYVAKMRGQEPLKELRTREYELAKEFLEGFEYDRDY